MRFVFYLTVVGVVFFLSLSRTAYADDPELSRQGSIEFETLPKEAEEAVLEDLSNHHVTIWSCKATGRVEAGLWGTFWGYGGTYSTARTRAINNCRKIAQGCHIVQCRPGL